jgi:hypothetical protein
MTMMRAKPLVNTGPFGKASYIIAGSGLVLSAFLVRFGLPAALLPLAMVFGWFQVGGL